MRLNNDHKPTVATIGFFDGVHLGHSFLLGKVREIAAQRGLSSAVISFPIHPRQVLQPSFQLEMLTSFEERKERLAQTGVDYLFPIDFTEELSQMSAYDFMRTVLRDTYHVSVLLIGHDHRFGHNRAEGFDDYCRYGKALGIEVMQAESFLQGVRVVSSSAIRALLKKGEIGAANNCLGYRYALCGNVVGGYQIGRKLGFPTANIIPTDASRLIPAVGVYAVWAVVNGTPLKGMLYISNRPTFNNGSQQTIEVHILDFQGDLYNQSVTIEFVARVRGEEAFQSAEALAAQLRRDAAAVTEMLKAY